MDDLRDHGFGRLRICRGARIRVEVTWFREQLVGEVIGTGISESAAQFPHLHTWEFHDETPYWEGWFDFVYTNSLD